MIRLEAITTKLQPSEVQLLQKYYKRIVKENAQHFSWEKVNEQLKQEYSTLKALDALGFVSLEHEVRSLDTDYTSYFLTLFSSAIYRAEYESYGRIRKWLVRNYLNYKDYMAVIAFFVSVVLAILKILEYIK